MNESKISERLDRKIEEWKKKLIDLSRRNRLLNFKPTKVTTVKIVEEIPSEIFRSLVVNSRSFSFLPKEDDSLLSGEEHRENRESGVAFHAYDLEELEEKYTDLYLQTNLPEERLGPNLKKIHFRATQLMEEQGYNILYLTLGMLEWYDIEHSTVKNRSPIIMVPVELRQRSVRAKYKLYRSEEDPFINPALQHKLSCDLSIELPDLPPDDEEIDPQQYYLQIADLIKSNARWKVTNDIYLGLFSFAKFGMFKDIEKYPEAYKNNIIIRALAGVMEPEMMRTSEGFITAAELDAKRKPLDLFQVVDADSSQQEVAEAVKSGLSLVVQGPPGTGKSQTITNLIAEALALKKTILFVSEKMAALDVVYRRLLDVNLGDFCLEIHSRKVNKKHVLNQLKEAYEAQYQGTPIIRDEIDQLVQSRTSLNEYVAALHAPLEPFGKSPYWILGQLNSLAQIEIMDLDSADFDGITFKQYQTVLESLTTLKERIEIVGPPSKHPFWGCLLSSIDQYEQQKLLTELARLSTTLADLEGQLSEFSSATGNLVNTIAGASSYCRLIRVLSEDHAISDSLIAIDDPEGYLASLQPILDKINEYQRERGRITEKYNEGVFDEQISDVHTLLSEKYSRCWRVFRRGYYKTKKSIKRHLKEKQSLRYSRLASDVVLIRTNRDLKETIDSTPKNASDPLSSLWQGSETDTDAVSSTLLWLIKYREARVSRDDDRTLLEYVRNSHSVPKELLTAVAAMEGEVLLVRDAFGDVKNSLSVNRTTVFPNGFNETPVDELLATTNRWESNTDMIVDWTRYQRAIERCTDLGLGDYVGKIEEHETEEVVNKFKKAFLFRLFKHILEQRAVLKDFEAITQDHIVKTFRNLDKYQLELSKLRVRETLIKDKPDTDWEGTKSSELGYLQRQFRLRRGHHPVRKIFTIAPNITQKLCPCFMMSPLSLAHYVDPSIIRFDIAVFDEASQMSPEDSLGAVIRGDQLVVVGDTKQLPPTVFFERVVQAVEDAEDEDSIDDLPIPSLESILDECLVIGMKQFTLKWHYRSRHESLIHFSNHHFYKNELNTFPSSIQKAEEFGVSLVHVKDSVYDRGKSGKNVKEAQEVAKAVVDHFKNNPDKSLGVGAFSQAQQMAIVDQVEVLRRQDPSMESFFSKDVEEPFFVKNLETVQGDERDVIFISIGYGRDHADRLTMVFGPLNKEGGERRLNVLITRAKEKVVVFSSILGIDFDLSRTQSVGVRMLKEYIEFAESKGKHFTFDTTFDFSHEFDEDNIFERSVYQQLRAEGIKVIPQVGAGGYKIDFGILHPRHPGRFILAVECDGASYHSSATARDRDRLRQQILENLGWRFHRIWSTDWFLNPSREMKKLKEAIENAQNSTHNPRVNKDLQKVRVRTAEPKKPKDSSGIRIIPYERYPTKNLGTAEEFYWKAKPENYGGWLEHLIWKIVTVEGPIHVKELSLRVIEHFGMKKVGSKISKLVEASAKRLSRAKEVVFRNQFIYQPAQACDFIRKRDAESAISIEFIPPEEIRNGVLLVLKKEVSVFREELIPKTARLFGFLHTGKKIRKYIDSQISALVHDQVVAESNFGLQCNEANSD